MKNLLKHIYILQTTCNEMNYLSPFGDITSKMMSQANRKSDGFRMLIQMTKYLKFNINCT